MWLRKGQTIQKKGKHSQEKLRGGGKGQNRSKKRPAPSGKKKKKRNGSKKKRGEPEPGATVSHEATKSKILTKEGHRGAGGKGKGHAGRRERSKTNIVTKSQQTKEKNCGLT